MPSNHFKIGMSNKAAAFHDCAFFNYECNKQKLWTDFVRSNYFCGALKKGW